MEDFRKQKQMMDLLNFSFEPQAEQFNMTAPENLMMPETPTLPPPVKKQVSRAPSVESAPAPETPAINPVIREHLRAKYGLLDPESYDAEMLKKQEEAKERKSGLSLAQFAAGMGDALAGRNPSESAKTFQGYRDNIDKETVGNLESRRKSQMDNLSSNSMMDKMQRDKDVTDPTSSQSMAFRKIIESKFPEVAKAYGPDWANVSAADQDLIFKPLQLKEQIEGRKQTASIIAGQRSDSLRAKQEEKLEKKKSQLFEIEDRKENILNAIDELDKMIDEDGTWEAFGSHNQDLDRKIDQISTDMAKLQDPQGVARPAEVELNKKNLISSGFKNSNSTARKVLQNFKGEVERRAETAHQIRGLESPGKTTSSKPETKVINGKTYKRVPGGWEEVG